MTTPIDCNRMSHASCYPSQDFEPEQGPRPTGGAPTQQNQAAAGADRDGGASYECVNDCVSSMGVSLLLSGAVTSLGCFMLPPACPVFIGASVGSTLGACQVACEDLEAKP